MNILGLNCAYHESAVALIRDNQLIAAIEEERLNRVKHAKPALTENPNDIPWQAINTCLEMGNLLLSDIDIIAFSFNPLKRLHNNLNLNEQCIDGEWGTTEGEKKFYKKLIGIPDQIRALGFNGQFMWVDHCVAHSASAYYPSPFKEAAVISIDGIGESESVTIGGARDGKLFSLKEINYPNSLGLLWEKVSMFMGMSEYDACKVMSLASFGDPARFISQFHQFVKVNEDGFEMDINICQFRSNNFASFEQVFGLPALTDRAAIIRDYMDLAAALQELTSEILLNIVKHAAQLYPSKNVCLAGGVALNCVANTAIFEQGPFENIYIQPAANDAGTALGAALYAYHNIFYGHKNPAFESKDTYLGPGYSEEDVLASLSMFDLLYERSENVATEVAALIAAGKVVGWFQGRMEFGPRALGNRSLLADPRDPDMVKRMNLLVKHREDHRPFCPSVLKEDAKQWFDIRKDADAAHYMLMAYPVKPEQRALIPAVVHVDGTSRIQLVSAESNSKYHELISAFKALTGVPMLLNTSFNDREPIVCSPEDALKTFLRTKIDFLVIDNFIIRKKDLPQSASAKTATELV
ncbi:MAG: carbamoyl transferase [Cellvibrio sp. 79]|nr:MAG: carbamoyl transferase [Cellvibrio sp. 79]